MKKIILSLVCGIVVLGLTVGCNKKEEITNNELTKEEIANIQKNIVICIRDNMKYTQAPQ